MIGVPLVLAALVIGTIALIEVASDPPAPDPGLYDAGEAEPYERGDVNYFDTEHAFVTRLADGEFMAFYDKSPKQQELGSDCRVQFVETAVLNRLTPLTDIKGAFVEECEGTRTTWRADGKFDGGAGYGDLDRFRAFVSPEGRLIIDLDDRSCTKSRGVPGIPPCDITDCEGKPD